MRTVLTTFLTVLMVGTPTMASAEGATLDVADLRGESFASGGKAACVAVPLVDDRCESWVGVYDNPNGYEHQGLDLAHALATSPDGSRVFVTGMSWDRDTGDRYLPGCTCGSSETHYDVATVAFDAASGAGLWAVRYNGPENLADVATAIAVSPDGGRVYVAGFRDAEKILFAWPEDISENADYFVIAYDSASGETLWVDGYDAPQGQADWGLRMTVGPGPEGDRVYLTGRTHEQREAVPGAEVQPQDITTVAFEGPTGERAWVARYDGPGSGYDWPHAIEVSPDGERVFVAGMTQGGSSPREDSLDYVTLAYDSGSNDSPTQSRGGTLLWATRYDGPAGLGDGAFSLGVSSDRVFVTGLSRGGTDDAVTVAYDARTGVQRWATRYEGFAPAGIDVGWDLAVAPDGGRVYVTGRTLSPTGFTDYFTAAYESAGGQQVWLSRYSGPSPIGLDYSTAIVASPDGSTVYVAGESTGAPVAIGPPDTWVQGESAVVAYETTAGSQVWVGRHNTSAAGLDTYAEPFTWRTPWASLSLAPDGRRLFLARTFAYRADPNDTDPTDQTGNYYDYGVVAYAT